MYITEAQQSMKLNKVEKRSSRASLEEREPFQKLPSLLFSIDQIEIKLLLVLLILFEYATLGNPNHKTPKLND